MRRARPTEADTGGYPDIADPGLYATEQPERVWLAMRRAGAPLWLSGTREHWALTRYRHVEKVYKSGSHFSSEKGMHLGVDNSRARLAAEAAAGKCLVVTDDPLHAEMRKAVCASFNQRAISRIRDRTYTIALELVSRAATGQPADFVEIVAAPLPVIVICDIVGVPNSDREYVMRLTHQAFSDSGQDPSSAQLAANAELFGYCDELVMSKRRTPGDDAASALAAASLQGAQMSHEAAVLNCHDLFAAGNETTRHASSAAALSMVSHPSQWQQLRAGLASINDAAEEILRFDAPLSHVMRVALEDFEIGDVTIRPGEFVTLWLRSANRDDEIFDRPDELLFTRRPNKHLTFGLGIHFCLGAFLARLELSAVISALLQTVNCAELADSPTRLASNFLRGYTAVPLSLRRRRD
jgi:cytochrome P450